MSNKHMVLYGPPGTGKTRLLLKLVDKFLTANQGRALFCSHTRAAAQEALSRWPTANDKRIEIATMHAVCFRALRLSRAQTVDHVKLEAFGREFGIGTDDDSLGKEFLDVLSLARSRRLDPGEAYEQSWRPGTPSHFEAFVTSYNQWKEVYGYLDFNDMLEQGVKRLRAADVPYKLIAVDEAQDLTPLHWRVVHRLMELQPDAMVLVAGDDDQSLYAFAGADPHGMPEFAERVAARSEVLSQSYRITQQVYDLAQAVIARVERRVSKKYAPRTGLDGKPAQGALQVWPHLDFVAPSRDRDVMVLYADRFVRAEVEPILQEQGYLYRALSGFPSPLDSRAGRTLRTIHSHTDPEIIETDELRNVVRAGLSRDAVEVWDRIGARQVLARLRRRDDYSMLAMRPQWVDYFRSVNWEAPQNIRISTMHGAKGLQADDVHLILALSPSAARQGAVDPDHLHRLIYTAVTRAKENLYLYDGENGYDLPEAFR